MKNSKKTVLVVTGSRSDYGQIRAVLHELLKSKLLRLEVIVTGMHTLKSYGYTASEVKSEMPVVAVVPVRERDSMLQSLAREIIGVEKYCRTHRPDLILVLGDRDEPFAATIVGGHLGIPVAHLHGGDKTGSVVDEYIRHAITKFSHLHFPATPLSAQRIKLLGEEPWRVLLSGSTGIDELRSMKTPTEKVLAKRYKLSPDKPWYVILHHPASLDSISYKAQVAGVMRASSTLNGEKIVLIPNADTGSKEFLNEINRYARTPDFHIFKHIPRSDLIGILKRTRVLIGNSTMGIIDASYLRLPSVNVGNRQTGREKGSNIIDCTYEEKSILRAIKKAESAEFRRTVATKASPYGDGHAAVRVVRFLERHINRSGLFHKKLTYV